MRIHLVIIVVRMLVFILSFGKLVKCLRLTLKLGLDMLPLKYREKMNKETVFYL